MGLSAHLFIIAISSACVNQVLELRRGVYKVDLRSNEFRSGLGTSLFFAGLSSLVIFGIASLVLQLNLLLWMTISPIVIADNYIFDYMISRGGSRIQAWVSILKVMAILQAEFLLRWWDIAGSSWRMIVWAVPALAVVGEALRRSGLRIVVAPISWIRQGGRHLILMTMSTFGLLQLTAIVLGATSHRSATAAIIIANTIYGPIGLVKASVRKVLVSRVRTGVMRGSEFRQYRNLLIIFNTIIPVTIAFLSFRLERLLMPLFGPNWIPYRSIIWGFAVLQIAAGLTEGYNLTLRSLGDLRNLQNLGVGSGFATYGSLCGAAFLLPLNNALQLAGLANLTFLLIFLLRLRRRGHFPGLRPLLGHERLR